MDVTTDTVLSGQVCAFTDNSSTTEELWRAWFKGEGTVRQPLDADKMYVTRDTVLSGQVCEPSLKASVPEELLRVWFKGSGLCSSPLMLKSMLLNSHDGKQMDSRPALRSCRRDWLLRYRGTLEAA